MENESKGSQKRAITEFIKEGIEESRRSLSRIEAEGEKFMKSLLDLADKYIPEIQRKAFEELTVDARKFFAQLNKTVEESTKKAVERLSLPTREDLENYNKIIRQAIDENVAKRLEMLKVPSAKELDLLGKQLRKNAEETVQKGLTRLNIATKKELDTLSRDVEKIKISMNSLRKAPRTQKKGAPTKAVKS